MSWVTPVFGGLFGGTGGSSTVLQFGTASATTFTNTTVYGPYASTGATWVAYQQYLQPQPPQLYDGPQRLHECAEYLLPDGATILIAVDGSYTIEDENAKVVYRACRVREFNPYINASDLLEAFIREVGKLDGVDQGDVLDLPIEAFINWIILEAAKKDGDPLEGLPSVESALARRLPGPEAQRQLQEPLEGAAISVQSLRDPDAIL